MTNFLIISAISMGVLLGAYHLLLEREKMHRFNRFYLIAAIVFSLALPFVSISIPEYVEIPEPAPVPIVVASAATDGQEVFKTHDQPATAVIPATPETNYGPYIFLGIYGMVTLILAIRFAVNIRHFYRIKAKSATVHYKGATLVLMEGNILPYTFFNNIFLNRQDYENRSIEPELFTHELAHVRQWHTADIIFIELLRTIFWFNPLLFLYKKAIRLNHEFLADDATIIRHRNVPTYQQLLLGKSSYASIHSLASSINFSITKKRFIMMTKTTNQTKGILLRLAVLPVAAGLIYALATQTVVYAKTTDGKAMPAMVKEERHKLIPEVFEAEILPEEEIMDTQPVNDSATARRDEYYKGVRIVIDDLSRNLLIDKPYEMLTNEQKELYLAEVPEKKKAIGVTQGDFEFYIKEPDALYYIDDKKVTTEVVKQHKSKDFATHRFTMSSAGGTRLMQVFLYTPKYFDKHIRHSQDHYPDKTYRITILDKALDFTESRNRALNPPNDGKTDLDLARERLKKESEKETYSYSEFVKEYNTTQGAKFPGGRDKFYKYIDDNFTMKDKLNGRELSILMSINTDGSVSEVEVKDVAPEVEDEIKKIVEGSPRWIPAQQNGQPLKMGYTITYPEKHK